MLRVQTGCTKLQQYCEGIEVLNALLVDERKNGMLARCKGLYNFVCIRNRPRVITEASWVLQKGAESMEHKREAWCNA